MVVLSIQVINFDIVIFSIGLLFLWRSWEQIQFTCMGLCVPPQAHPDSWHLSPDDLSARHPVLSTAPYTARREVVLRGSLPPGHYIIIPSTFKPNQQGAFMLRVLTEEGNAAM